jgi:predicted permease
MTSPSSPSLPPPRRPDAALDEEFAYHLDRTVAALVEAGWDEDAARREAARRFGSSTEWRARILRAGNPGVQRMAHQTRRFSDDAVSLVPRLIGAIARDVRFAWRNVRGGAAVSIVTIATLALGLGGTVTMFAAVNAAFLTPLPYPDEQTLVKVYQASRARSDIAVPLPVLLDWSRDTRAFAAIGGYLSGIAVNVQSEGDATRARLARVSRPVFHAIGVAPVQGRIFSDADLRIGAPPVVIIGHALATRLFGPGGDPLTSRLRIDGAEVPIVGVMPEGFTFPDGTDLWAPVEPAGPLAYGDRTAHNFTVVGRLSSGATVASAKAELDRLSDEQEALSPAMARANLQTSVVPLRVDLLGAQADMVWIGLAAVVCVLLVACVNVANLMLARNLTRETDTGIRLALGAGRGEIVRLILVEGIVLASAGAGLGLVLAMWGTGLIEAMAPESVTGGEPLRIDARVVGLTVMATAAAGLLCAVLPALRTSRVDPREALAGGGRGVASSPRRVMNALAGVEVALAFVLIFSAGVLGRSHARLDAVDLGYRTEGLLLARFSLGALPGSAYATPDVRRGFFERLEQDLSTLPGLRSLGLTALTPPGFSPNGQLFIEGRTQVGQAHWRLVGGDYFRAMGIVVRRGRVFQPEDGADAAPVAVINESLARLAFPNQDPMGQRIAMPGMDGGSDTASTIVGIVGDVRHRGPHQPPVPEAYFSYRQRPWRTYGMTVVIDASTPTDVLVDAVRAQARAVDPGVPPDLRTMEAAMAPFLEPSAFRARLLVVLAGIALGLAIVGIAGVVSYGVARRRREMGIRAALGASPRAIVGLVTRAGLWPVVAGAAAGAIGALAAGRWLASFVFGVSERDPVSLALTAAALLVAGLIASWWPARRAARVDPAAVLRP